MKKIMIIDGGPRKGMNTAQMVEAFIYTMLAFDPSYTGESSGITKTFTTESLSWRTFSRHI